MTDAYEELAEIDVRAAINLMLRNPSYEPSAGRLRAETLLRKHNSLVNTMARIVVANDNGSLRTVSGGTHHASGWYPSVKVGRTQHYESLHQLALIERCETDPNVVHYQSEARRFEFILRKKERYTSDVDILDADGRLAVVEVKGDDADLRDPEYRLKLAGVAEICRRVGHEFRITFGSEIFENSRHRFNVRLASSMRRTAISSSQKRLVESLRSKGDDMRLGEFAELMAPGNFVQGRAITFAMLVRRIVSLDLTQPLIDEMPVSFI